MRPLGENWNFPQPVELMLPELGNINWSLQGRNVIVIALIGRSKWYTTMLPSVTAAINLVEFNFRVRKLKSAFKKE